MIGLTGGIAAGKSTVGVFLQDLGARVVDADDLAREVVLPGTEGLRRVAQAFGEGILDPRGSLDRRRLAEIVFQDPARREELEGILHPLIAELARVRLGEAARGAPLAVYQAPLIFETGRQHQLRGTLLVDLDPGLQLSRLRSRDHLSEAAARSRLAAQMEAGERLRLADWVVDNSGPREQTREAVTRLWEGPLRRLRLP